ncbi:hypothetical protein [Nevskia sp.]|uniref:hypothetical protein n=1 Tax=Nevskia sp. TaxID=1929292 RepID=UPI0025FE09B7|nr:hypothetical protein [Nevskia sp.]HET7797283.1 hypothetical protein [Nevskia sp.]
MEHFFASGRVVDLVLFVMLAEAVLLISLHQLKARGPAPVDLIVNLLSGFCLLLALRAALSGAGWHWIALALTGSLIGHLADLRRRWR